MPDILHQLHKGLFKDHISNWATKAAKEGSNEVDEHYRTMSHHPDLHHFKKGINLMTQWSSTEYKQMEKVFLGILDFTYYAHFEMHMDESLQLLDTTWLVFHQNKDVFKDLEI
ncbi:hypothetical protein NLJ89_g10674 [Agrocybe chaxingu]|uniref:Uncharacterized protein n=1 Tax=Agrocybe chaxingu TaxID=84603 RepID=A0A9W8MSD9_9AGAR|nr:hypothetical protein NLJ89_g10674 [Agrocybe chaxingu]